MAIGRSDTMHELITLMESVYEETIIGSDINIVKHLFYYLKADGKEIDFIYNEMETMAVVEEIFEDSLTMHVPDFNEAGQRRARVRFEIMNILYQFEIIILDVRSSILTIKIPTELQSMQLRQNKRLPVDDLFMNFIILFRSLSGGAREVGKNLYAERRFPHLMKEIRRDKPNLKLINIMVTDYIKTVSQDYKIVIFKDDDSVDDIEAMIRGILSHTDKSIYISDCSKIESYIEKLDDEYLCNFHEEYNKLKKDLSEDETKGYFLEIQKLQNREFMVSYVITAIRIYGEVIGYIKVFTTAMDRYAIVYPQAIFIHELSEISNYAFTKVAIQVTSFEEYTHSTKIVDISMDGLLFEITNRKLFNYLKRHNIIKMNIPLSSDVILKIRGAIVRYIERDGLYYLGVNFFDSNPGDMLNLETYLFEKSMNILSE
ncbi:MAG: DUF1577 domain-containing protein [Leptospira sp.]|nr:DUF1577 domain-containing protein [Leptospira sp.]